MAILNPNTLIGIIQGRLGDLVFVRTKDGRVIVRPRPAGNPHSSPGERKGQARLVQANDYVAKLRQTPGAYGVYQAAARLNGKRACDLAKADFSHPPVISDIDLSPYTGRAGEAIRVQATDDFEVQRVHLRVTQLDGTLLEVGEAGLEPDSSWWRYLTQTQVAGPQTVFIQATAYDRPGNPVAKAWHYALVAP